MALGFDVPPEYFYALTANLPINVDADVRYQLAVSTPAQNVVNTIQSALDAGVIVSGTLISPEQAAWRLAALGGVSASAPTFSLSASAGEPLALFVPTLVTAWLNWAPTTMPEDPVADLAAFWDTVTPAANPTFAAGQAALALCAMAQQGDLSTFFSALALVGPTLSPPIAIASVQDLDPSAYGLPGPAITVAQWNALFLASPSAVPEFATVGTAPVAGATGAQLQQIIGEQTNAFVLRLAHFFGAPGPAVLPFFLPVPGTLPTLPLPSGVDPFAAFAVNMGAGFVYGSTPTLNLAAADTAAALVFPGDLAAQAWLVEAASAINALTWVTDISGFPPPISPTFVQQFRFTLAESLYARGFVSVAQIAAVPPNLFIDALIGTPAYPYALAILTRALAGAPPATPPAPPGPPFGPINPGGKLVNCVVPPWFSPFGPVAYLRDLWSLPETATCEEPSPVPPGVTLGAAVGARRGLLAEVLLATKANLETPLPRIDLVNECLESLVAGAAVPVIYQTTVTGEDAARVLAAVPEWSTPVTAQPGAYSLLATDFSSPALPYAQAEDVSGSYLGALGTSRFAALHRFRKEISEFVLDPAHAPPGFQGHRWRYPLLTDLAREYLRITAAEYATLFTTPISAAELPVLYGFPAGTAPGSWEPIVIILSQFLLRTGLTYAELVALAASGFVPIHVTPVGGPPKPIPIPECPPCCLDDYILTFAPMPVAQALMELAVFIRLWRKLREIRGARYTFAVLADIALVLGLFSSAGAINPDFIRQLVAFQLLRDEFHLPLTDPRTPPPPGAVGSQRTELLALFDPSASASAFQWAVDRLIDGIAHHARGHHGAKPRASEFIKLLASNLDELAPIAGFDPATAKWSAFPTRTLRFAEVLSKLYASPFGVGELLFVCTARPGLDGDDPFPLPTAEESEDAPLDLPDDSGELSLAALRKKLLHVEISAEEAREWTWPRIEAALRDEFGFVPSAGTDPVLALGSHLFPTIVEQSGTTVSAASRQYRVGLHTIDTAPAMWNAPPDGPFRYDIGTQELWTEVPLRDEAVLEKLSRIRPLSGVETSAVQSLYFQPRLELAPFGFLFRTPEEADRSLLQEGDEQARWAFFQLAFAHCHRRCRALAHHLALHVAALRDTGEEAEKEGDERVALAWAILKRLSADENPPTIGGSAWENDTPPATVWTLPTGGAFAALLGLLGTGLMGELHADSLTGPVVWREPCGPMEAFGRVRNLWDAPLPTVLPALNAALPPAYLGTAGVRNGIAVSSVDGRPYGGIQGHAETWTGVFLVDEAGPHRFFADKHAEGRAWKVTLQRGQKSWVVLAHDWPSFDGPSFESSPLALKRGAYDLTIEFVRCPPELHHLDEPHPVRTGFELRYTGPGSDREPTPLPLRCLFVKDKTPILRRDGAGGIVASVLAARYVSTLRDIRRTYQRALKAMLFAYRFDLHAKPFADFGQSEIGYLLDNAGLFAGMSFTGASPSWTTHRAWLDLDLLPVSDPYEPPATDIRATPSLQRQQALLDVWERIFDYTRLRRETRTVSEQPVWLLFDEASENPASPSQIVRYVGVTPEEWPLVGDYEDGTATGYLVTPADLEDEIWATRVWHAQAWLRRLMHDNPVETLTTARPFLWVADDPVVNGGNANLIQFFRDMSIGAHRRYDDLLRLDDGLRERARHALLANLCGPAKIYHSPNQLSGHLLIDVEAGRRERASRIDDAVSAVQAFVQRARLGLEPSWTPSEGFLRLWDSQYATYHAWLSCKRRETYRENWVEWEELAEARRTEAFRFLENELCRSTLTVPVPGGMTYWVGTNPPGAPPVLPPPHPGLQYLQAREPSTIDCIPSQPEALDLRGTPEWSGQRSWLASVPSIAMFPHPQRDEVVVPKKKNHGHKEEEAAKAKAAAPIFVTPQASLPWWIEAAVRLGTKFLRVPAAAVPPASNPFAPHHHKHESPCCKDCGRRHDATMDEYYFWLVDERFFARADVPIQDANSNWNDDPGPANPDLPGLLSWQKRRNVFLMWARMHDGVIQQPRRSTRAVTLPAPPPTPPVLFLDGRSDDSIYFTVQNADAPPPGLAPSPLDVGFRYDIATDSAVVFPEVSPDVPPPLPTGIAPLPAYPYFGYFKPGAPLAPLSTFSESVAVAGVLRAHCHFEAALQWYKLTLDPLGTNVGWCKAAAIEPPPLLPHEPHAKREHKPKHKSVEVEVEVEAIALKPPIVVPSACCKSGAVPLDVAKDRAITLDYLETLLEWGDAVMRRNAPEAFEYARVIFDTAEKILGRRPVTVLNELPPGISTPPPTVVNLPTTIPAPVNPRLMTIYDRVTDRLALIHTNQNAHRLRNGRLREVMPYWIEDHAPERAWRPERSCCSTCGQPEERCECDCDWCCLPSPYRFTTLSAKATEFANEVRGFAAALQSAFEKGDAETLVYVRANQERQLTERAIAIREDAWRAADWDVQALEQAKLLAQNQLQYYTALVAAGLIPGETAYQSLTNGAVGALTAAVASLTTATIVGVIPDLFVGTSDFAWLPLGTKMAAVFQGIAAVSSTAAQIMTTNAGLQLTEAGWDRRNAEWLHQIDVFTIQIAEIERQILAAQRRRDSALHELNNAVLQAQQSREVLDILRDKFTSTQFYLYLQRETAAHLREMYDLALHVARQAERAFNFERGYTSRHFLPAESWNSLREGLLAGDRLALAVRRMEQCYRDENVREYELTKHISLRQLFPRQFLQLKLTGRAEIELPEWLFDLDYPGQYMRRIKNVSLTIPCVAGPYTGVHCRLTLLASETRIAPWLLGPLEKCCKHHAKPPPPPASPCGCWAKLPVPPKPHHERCDDDHDGYDVRPDDPRIVRRYLAREAIATSSGQNDTGLFELNFRDERYLPFEFEGAVSRWRIELPPENNYFDMNTLSDVVLHLNYTTREGGDVLRRAASSAAEDRLPDSGHRFLDVRQTLPTDWLRFAAHSERDHERRLDVRIDRDDFQFLPGRREYWVTRIEVVFEAPDAHPGDHHELRFVLDHKHGCKHPAHPSRFRCVASHELPGVFRGVLDVPIGPVGRDEKELLGSLVFGPGIGEVRNVFLNVGYLAVRRMHPFGSEFVRPSFER